MTLTPFYADDLVTLYHGDCLEILPKLDVQADAMITDPPYGQTSLHWDRFSVDWVPLIGDVVKPTGQLWCWGTLRSLSQMIPVLKRDWWHHGQDIVWEKHNGSTFHADRFRIVHELCAQFYRGPWEDVYRHVVTTPDATKKTIRRKKRPKHTGDIGGHHYTSHDGGPRMMRSVFHVRSCHGNARHPTQKPAGVLYPLIEYSVPPGGLVIDPFAGSGSLLEAARATGRRAIGIEQKREHCEGLVDALRQGILPGVT